MPIIQGKERLIAPTGVVTVTREIDGIEYTLETGKIAKQARGAVLVKAGGTVVLATVVMGDTPKEGQDFFPLTVDYREMFYAAGKIPGGFFRRESRPDERQTLVARLIDRPLRPLFPEGMRNETVVQLLVISADNIHPPDILAMSAASAALHISNIPWSGPLGGVRVARIDGQLKANPTFEEIESSDMNILVAATAKAITMVEAGVAEASEEDVVAALAYGQKKAQIWVEMQEELRKKCGKEKISVKLIAQDEALEGRVREAATDRIRTASRNSDKLAREADVKNVFAEVIAELFAKDATLEPKKKAIKEVLETIESEIVRADIIAKGARPDGRRPDEIRPIAIELDVLPEVHGSALFTRGQTQALATVTLGSTRERRRLDDIEGEGEERFMLHYNFPGFSVGEAKRVSGPGRREIGHGALARRAIEPLLPAEEEFAYTIRVVSDILESNGSSSMASVCGGSIALMAAGVPLKAACAGIAMGLIMDDAGKYAILTDIQGLEDHFGDMDFKVTGTREGITALQMDIKVEGLSMPILTEALTRAKKARLEILEVMDETLAEPRAELSLKAPRMTTIKIDIEKIKDVIGPGGKMIRKIQAETGADINVEDDGRIFISAVDGAASEAAREMIEALTASVNIGEIYEGRVTRLMKFGAFVEILPGKEGLCHISQLSKEGARRPEDAVKEGDTLKVQVVEVDDRGRVNVSHKAILLAEGGMNEDDIRAAYKQDMASRERSSPGGRGGFRGGRDGGRGGFRGGRDGGGDRDRGPRRFSRDRD